MSVWNAVISGRAFGRSTISRATGISVLATLAFAVASLILLHIGNNLIHGNYWSPSSWRIYLPLGASLAAAAALINTKYDVFEPMLKACLRASAVGLLVLLLIEAPDYSLANPEAVRAEAYVRVAYWTALAASIGAIFRPAFVVPVVIYLASCRQLVTHISGLEMSFLDIRYMLDMAMYLAVFGLFVVKAGPRIHPWLASPSRQLEIVGVGMGLHLANYFWSGIAKLAAGPTPWYWIFENQTNNQIPHTIESGILPTGHLPWLSQLSYDLIGFFNAPLNAAIVLAQLFAIICVLKINWLKIAAVLFDLLHIGIFIFGGLFFWPWIWNNITVWWAARSQKKAGLQLNTKVACICAIVLGAPALHINSAAWLAWFDVAEARQVRFDAVTDDGRTIRVPSAFFLSHSYSVSHGYMGYFDAPGHYEPSQLASSDSVERNERSRTCPDPSAFPQPTPETEAERAARQRVLGDFLVNHHAKMKQREAAVGRGSWYFQAHHHPSNPFLYDEFNALSLDRVVGYNLVLESVCHSMKDGVVSKQVKKRDTEFHSVR